MIVIVHVLESRSDNVYIHAGTHHECSPTEWVLLYLPPGIFIKNQSQSQNKADLESTKNFEFSKVLSQNKGYIKAVME